MHLFPSRTTRGHHECSHWFSNNRPPPRCCVPYRCNTFLQLSALYLYPVLVHILQSIRALPCVFIAVFVVVLLLRRRNYIHVLSCSQGSRVLRYTRFFFVLFMLFYPDVIDTKRFVSSHCRRKKRWRPLMLSFPNGRKSRSGKAGVDGSRAENKSSRRASDETAREMKKVRKFQFTVTVTSCCN